MSVGKIPILSNIDFGMEKISSLQKRIIDEKLTKVSELCNICVTKTTARWHKLCTFTFFS